MHEMEKPDGWVTIDLRDGAVEGEDADEMEEGSVRHTGSVFIPALSR